MLDDQNPRHRAIAALMRLAETKPWREIFLPDIATEAGLTYAELTAHFASKTQILSAFVEAVDAEAAAQMAAKPATEGPRDRLFDAIMTRFDVLAPYRAALRRLAAEAPETGLAIGPRRHLTSLRSTLESARIASHSLVGCLRLTGLGGLYARTFATWLDDDDPALARTMAKLDRQLRSGERAMRTVEDVSGGVSRLLSTLCSARGRRTPAAPSEPPSPAI